MNQLLSPCLVNVNLIEHEAPMGIYARNVFIYVNNFLIVHKYVQIEPSRVKVELLVLGFDIWRHYNK